MHPDYQWILSSPSLMNIADEMDATLWLSDLSQLHTTKLDSCEFLPAKRAPRLGIHYENLVNDILNSLIKPIDIKRNIQVVFNGITLGEFDFIGGNQQKGFHLECAIKYYLRIGTGAQLSDFVGPGKRDRLDIKWNRMCEKQITLSDTDAGKEICSELGIQPTDKKILIQGFLFHPYTEQPCPDLHPSINPEHNKGWWLRQRDIHLLDPTDQFLLMTKPFWLTAQACYEETCCNEQIEKHEESDRNNDETAEVLDIEKLQEILSKAEWPLLFSRGNLINGKWAERDRGFIVGNEW